MKPESTNQSWRRFLKLNFKPVDKKARRIEKASMRHAHKFVIRRWSNVRSIRRHVVAWLFLVVLLCGLAIIQTILSYRSVFSQQPIAGGVYAEGVVDTIETLDPLFAKTQAEVATERLLFSGLLRYDENGNLQPDLATDVSIQEKGKRYIITLRDGVTWHDGKPFTAEDVLFTIGIIQNPAVGATAYQSWRGIAVSSPNRSTIVFDLPNAYAPFASQLTTSILPKHILGKVKPALFRQDAFSQQPVGTGPFKMTVFKTLDGVKNRKLVQVEAFNEYWRGRPLLNILSLTTYGSEVELMRALTTHQINAASDISEKSYRQFSTKGVADKYGVPLNNGVYSFLNMDSLSLKDINVRQALLLATDTSLIQKRMIGEPLAGPVIAKQLPRATAIAQASFDQKKAAELFAKAGYTKDSQGRLVKDKQPLKLRIAAVDSSGYREVVALLGDQWEKLGVTVIRQHVDPEQIQQSILRTRDYDVLVYEVEIGGDPDVYAYWHSSQASPSGLNFSNYKSSLASDALLAGRSRADWAVRDTRYESFAKQWVADTPAIALYRSTLRYALSTQANGVAPTQQLPTTADRYTSVTDWSVETGNMYKTP
jgi:peptide/nickel transport system substrate-binding protein